MLDDSGAIVLLRQAIAADPSYFPPHFQLSSIYASSGLQLELRRLYDSLPSNPTVACMRAFVSAPAGYRVHSLERILAIEQHFGANHCTLFMRAYLAPNLLPKQLRPEQQLAATTRALRAMSEFGQVVIMHAAALSLAGRDAQADHVLRQASANSHILDRLKLLSTLRARALGRGDTQSGERIKQLMQTLSARDGRPGVVLLALDPWQENGEARRLAMERQIAIARAHRAHATAVAALITLGNASINSGDNLTALHYLNQATAAARDTHSAGLQMLAYRLRGRAFSKVGDIGRARRDLESAIALYPQVRDDYELAETYHNLAHVYEGAGQLREAAAAIDRFVELTRPFVHAQPRMMSLHDAAEIRWKAGWHAAADVALAEMVRVVDAQQSNHYWAGEYYERAGEYTKAKRYYTAGVKSGADLSLNYAGLARVYETLGAYDSANAAAQQHDRIMADQFDVPLRPQMLLRFGRTDDAVRIAREWVGAKAAQQHVQGEARARNALAEVYLAARRPNDALQEAQRAAEQATRLNLTTERATATRLVGLSYVRGGNAHAALPVLQRAADQLSDLTSIEERRLTHIALAEALAQTGDTVAALAQYRRAASHVDTISFGLVEDLTRARFRSNQRMAYDRAISLLLASPQKNIAALVEWSQRRKASALSFGAADPRVRTLAEIQNRIATDEAVIDYIVVDTTIAALVLTRSAARVTVLGGSEQRARALIERVRGPLLKVHAGRVDLARANLDGAAAYALYKLLLEPLIRNVNGLRTLTIAPDGALHGVVFDALVVQPAAIYLIDRFAVRQIPSLALLSRSEALPARSSVLIVSRETPGLAREVAGVRATWRDARVTMLERADATERAVQQQRPAFDVVHIATHARADERDPMGSFLELSAGANADGFLHVSEIAAQDARNRLVVLSACETLGGPVFAGEGVMGVARAFLTSGARNVVATTWPVGAATADLMTAFYRNLNAGATVSDALRAAKLELRRKRATAHPFYWASFVLVTK